MAPTTRTSIGTPSSRSLPAAGLSRSHAGRSRRPSPIGRTGPVARRTIAAVAARAIRGFVRVRDFGGVRALDAAHSSQFLKEVFCSMINANTAGIRSCGMNSKDRYWATTHFAPVDHPFQWEMGPYEETLKRWRKEGLPEDSNWYLYGGYDRFEYAPVSPRLCPGFEVETLEEDAVYEIYRDADGVIKKKLKDVPPPAMPQYLDYPLKGREQWPDFQRRLNPAQPGAFPAALGQRQTAVREPRLPAGHQRRQPVRLVAQLDGRRGHQLPALRRPRLRGAGGRGDGRLHPGRAGQGAGWDAVRLRRVLGGHGRQGRAADQPTALPASLRARITGASPTGCARPASRS